MKIVTAVVNNPIFIEIQYYTLKKYFIGNYEFIVFNDAKEFPDFTNGYNTNVKKEIEDICKKYNIQCIDIPNENHRQMRDAAVRCADSMNFILKYQLDNPDKYLLLDSDMFLVDYLDISKYSNYSCAIVAQERLNYNINYIWNGIYYFDIIKMKNLELLNWNCCTHCDVGGMMQKWFETELNIGDIKNKETFIESMSNTKNIYFIKHNPSLTWDINSIPENLKNKTKLIDFFLNDPRNENNKFFCEIYDNIVLHYRAGGNWRNEGINTHQQLSSKLKNALIE